MALKETNLNQIKYMSKLLLQAVPVKSMMVDGVTLPLCQHPFIDSTWTIVDGDFVNLENNEMALENFYKKMIELIDKASDIAGIYNRIGNPWKLTFFKHTCKYMSDKDFAVYLADAWTTEEKPNMDVNCSVMDSVRFFRKANKKLLMVPEDYRIYEGFPDELTVYRGVGVGRIARGLSWTANNKTAEWFAHRFDDNASTGYVQSMNVYKKNILAYFNTRNEDEIVVDIFKQK